MPGRGKLDLSGKLHEIKKFAEEKTPATGPYYLREKSPAQLDITCIET